MYFISFAGSAERKLGPVQPEREVRPLRDVPEAPLRPDEGAAVCDRGQRPIPEQVAAPGAHLPPQEWRGHHPVRAAPRGRERQQEPAGMVAR